MMRQSKKKGNISKLSMFQYIHIFTYNIHNQNLVNNDKRKRKIQDPQLRK